MRAFVLMLLTIYSEIIFGQINGGFEENELSGCRNSSAPYTVDPFNQRKVTGWKSSHGTAQINKTGCPTGENYVHSGNNSAFLSFDSINKEGIFQEHSIKKDESFNVSLYARKYDYNSVVIIKFSNGLVNESPATPGGTSIIPTPPSEQQVVAVNVTSNNWNEFRVNEIIADDDYSQVWIYAINGTVIIDDFSISKSCCDPFKIWQNVINPPSTFVNNFIKAGKNIDPNQTAGEVLITTKNNLTKFQAGQRIDFLPGFKTLTGVKFEAVVKPCGETPFTVFIDTLYGNTDCEVKFTAQACFGSGDYTFSWGNFSSQDPTTTELIPLNQNRWVTLTVVDNIFLDTITKSIYLYKANFNGEFDINIFNVITPNNDGINDVWIAIDSTRLGSDSFGYNAYKYDLSIHNRWEALVYKKSNYNIISGFSYNEISWLDNACAYTGGSTTLFGVLELQNCDNYELIEFVIEVICPTSEPYKLNIDTTKQKNEIIVFPNPSSAKIYIESNKSVKYQLLLYNSNGFEVFNTKVIGNYSMDIGSFSKGTYVLKIITTNNQQITKKLIFY